METISVRAESRGAGDGRRTRRSDSDCGHYGRPVEWFRPGEFGATAITRRRKSDYGLPGAGSGPADKLSAIADARFVSGQPASADDQLHRARGQRSRYRGRGSVASAGHIDRCRGVGKTRLALEVAAQLAHAFPDGVWVFELAAVTDPAAVPDAVATALGITQQPGRKCHRVRSVRVGGSCSTLLFDNCEHVVDAAAERSNPSLRSRPP